MSKYLTTKIIGVDLDWAFEQSDHASVSIELKLDQDIIVGPGLTVHTSCYCVSDLLCVKCNGFI